MDNIKDYVTYPKKIKHYDTSKRPKRQTKFAAGVMYLLSKALMPRQVQGYKIDKINTENLKPPYILLCNHHTFVDFQINCIATYPHRVNNIATVEAFYLRAALIEWLGCICKRKFTTDLSLVRASYKVLKEYGDVLCGKRWEMTELGELKAQSGETYFSHIPDWFEWERSEVRRQLEEGTYSFSNDVRVYSLPWTRSFVYLGDAHLTHDAENGFVLEGEYNGEKYRIHRTPQSMYSLHVEYDYCHIEKDDCIDISTKDDSFFCYPSQKNCITKLSFATEEIYKMIKEKKNKKI